LNFKFNFCSHITDCANNAEFADIAEIFLAKNSRRYCFPPKANSRKYSDFYFSLILFSRLVYMDMVWDLGSIFCKVSSSIVICLLYSSVWLLVALSFDRYFAVCKPIKAVSHRLKKLSRLEIETHSRNLLES
jgi:hypothetical protein